MTRRVGQSEENAGPVLDDALAILDAHPEYLEAFPPELRAVAEALLEEN